MYYSVVFGRVIWDFRRNLGTRIAKYWASARELHNVQIIRIFIVKQLWRPANLFFPDFFIGGNGVLSGRTCVTRKQPNK